MNTLTAIIGTNDKDATAGVIEVLRRDYQDLEKIFDESTKEKGDAVTHASPFDVLSS